MISYRKDLFYISLHRFCLPACPLVLLLSFSIVLLFYCFIVPMFYYSLVLMFHCSLVLMFVLFLSVPICANPRLNVGCCFVFCFLSIVWDLGFILVFIILSGVEGLQFVF